MKEERGSNNKSRRCEDLALEGQKHLEGTVEAAHEILASMNQELCNPSLWIPPTGREQEPPLGGGGGGALEDARLRYKSSVDSLRVLISLISSSQDGDTIMGTENMGDHDEIQILEKRVGELREEVTKKNHHLKVLIDQLRDFVSDISMWQGPVL